MYDRQFWFHPETLDALVLTLYLDGSIAIDSEGLDVEALLSKINEIDNDSFEHSLEQIGFQFITNLNLPTFTIKGANNE
jgi:hypothetical protein